ncbi:hypothetical protein OJF2_29780 [Aquisphaera giovannonii]|uniref:DUF1559 domain-containing protein n=2 Tax=Aquisphaera giovannonii TaxID=406548 RepID=A0A5B9W2E6_9BACT|nr:hypothetical protein OJF2_29780 [Aquisphaera giovannonii]
MIAVAISIAAALTALLAVTIRDAREEGVRRACEMNLKQIGLAIGEYHVVHDRFPLAAAPSTALAPGERLSWQFAITPSLFCYHCYGMEDYRHDRLSASWRDAPQRDLAAAAIATLLCPDAPYRPSRGALLALSRPDPSRTSPVPATYIGIAGLGKDAPSLKKGDPRCGIFGYDRVTTSGDIADGASATMMVAETSTLAAPWTSGGEATVRGLDPSRVPYLGAGRQFGGNHPGKTQVLFADGSVRTIRDAIDPKVFEALSTIAGGEVLPGGWER